jgi:asparagine synthetase B (glutamine-hydrolysing)
MRSGSDVLPPLSNVWLFRSNNQQLVATVGARIDATPGLVLSHRQPTAAVAIADLPGQPSTLFFSSTSGRRAWFAEGQPAEHELTSRLVDACFENPPGLRSFPGDFGFVAMDANGEVRVVRSCAGLVPWLVQHDHAGTVVSTRNAWFARLLPEAPGQDLLAHLALTDGVTLVDRRTPWRGVTAVRCGHVLVCPRGGTAREVRYWNPVDNVPLFPVGPRKVEQAARDLRAALIESLDHGLSSDDVNLLGLSGGVDSSCLGALITQEVKRPVMAFTFFDESSPDDLRSLANVRFAALAAEFTKPTHTWTSIFGHSSLMHLVEGSLRLGVPIGHPTLLALPAMAAERRIETFVGGELADDLFAGPHVWRYDWFARYEPRCVPLMVGG